MVLKKEIRSLLNVIRVNGLDDLICNICLPTSILAHVLVLQMLALFQVELVKRCGSRVALEKVCRGIRAG
jgi:hypothetical protein